ncbi:hypothetical protein [Pelagibacterium sp.]|uniref:hypothetical protein n=1 Tax=Pelagibacterium sp. TaxID=1967288 RepID=UPI003A9537B7
MSKEVNWQEECLKKGFEYVREPDDHYVIADPSEMVALLRDLLGVDVRTKDGDSYGVAVCELQEQVDGLISTLHAQQAERDALLAERDALRSALERFYNANQARLKLLSREAYLDMQRLPGMRDALYEMDDAQHQAFAALQGEQP